jgi:hypothetical protein
MRKHAYSDLEHTRDNTQPAVPATPMSGGLPNRLMTAFEVAEFVGCHEETVRRAYLRGLLVSQRLDKNPLENIRNTQTIWRVIKDGWLFDPDTLRSSGHWRPVVVRARCCASRTGTWTGRSTRS